MRGLLPSFMITIIPLLILLILLAPSSCQNTTEAAAVTAANTSIPNPTTSNATNRDPNPLTWACDMYSGPQAQCPSPLVCGSNGKCSCLGDQIYSPSRKACKMRAGEFYCGASGDCTDWAQCFHRQSCYYCHERWSRCDCMCGPLDGNFRGACPSIDQDGYCSATIKSVESTNFEILAVMACLWILI